MNVLTEFTLCYGNGRYILIGENKHNSKLEYLEIQLPINPNSEVQFIPLKLSQPLETDTYKPIARKAFGVLGVIKFTSSFYILLITKCSIVSLLGGHKIYHIDDTQLVPLPSASPPLFKPSRSELKLLSIFQSLDLSKTFYFSPTYDLTNTLQLNINHTANVDTTTSGSVVPEEMFVWNSHMLKCVPSHLRKKWFRNIIHGFIDQAKISVFGNDIHITLIARRSHYFAGTRFFKRGVNSDGYPANEVETEQIVSNGLSSQFNSRYTSYVQHRASICVSWSQTSSNMSLQPPINLNSIDPFYSTAAKHFNRMFKRYGPAIRVFNLVKTKEKRPRESILSKEFENCIKYLNQFCENAIEYKHWDMSRASKGNSTDVMDYLGKYAKKTLESTQIFHLGKKVQNGVCRTNCIDCLDRTNAAQSVIGKYALGYQLYALGIIDKQRLDYDTDVMDLLTEMYHDHGDTLALQYGGSNLVNTVETYRRINQWSSHSRDLVESLRRYYTNSFVDHQRQDAINVFLGNFEHSNNLNLNLWDLDTDYYLHNTTSSTPQLSYRKWFVPKYMRLREPLICCDLDPKFKVWPYSPFYTPLNSLFMFRINSTNKYSNSKSPFALHWKRPKQISKDVEDQETNTITETVTTSIDDDLTRVYTEYLNPVLTEPSYPEYNYEVNTVLSDYTHKYKLEPETLRLYTEYVSLQ